MEKIRLITQELDLSESEVLHRVDLFRPEDWTIRRGNGDWVFDGDCLRGYYNPAQPGLHGQIFYRSPVVGDVVMAFEARLLPPSGHDLIWWWQTSFEEEPWGEGYLGCLGGWYGDFAGIERTPSFRPSVIFAWKKLESGRTYRIVSGSVQGTAFVAVDGELILFYADPNPIDPQKEGWIGFGLYQSNVEYRNLRIYRPKQRSIPVGYR